MFPPLQPLQLLLVIFAGWVNRRQVDVIDVAHTRWSWIAYLFRNARWIRLVC
jgi:hypothetical protein